MNTLTVLRVTRPIMPLGKDESSAAGGKGLAAIADTANAPNLRKPFREIRLLIRSILMTPSKVGKDDYMRAY